MNKKILFLILLLSIVVIPTTVFGATLGGMVGAVQGTLEVVGGAIVFIGWIITGILWLLSGGSPEKTGTAKKAIVACTIGTILVILASASGQIMGVIKSAFGL